MLNVRGKVKGIVTFNSLQLTLYKSIIIRLYCVWLVNFLKIKFMEKMEI